MTECKALILGHDDFEPGSPKEHGLTEEAHEAVFKSELVIVCLPSGLTKVLKNRYGRIGFIKEKGV